MQQLKQYLTFITVPISTLLFIACTAISRPYAPQPTPTAMPGVSIPFEPVAVGVDSNFRRTSDGTSESSYLVIAEDAFHLQSVFEQLVVPQHLETINNLYALDLEEYTVIALFRSTQPYSGYGINITQIIVKDETVYIYAEFSEPRPDQGVTHATTHPYQIIKISRTALPNKELDWVLVSYPTFDPTLSPSR